MGKIEEINHNGQRIFLKKDWTGWRTVDPVMDPLSNKVIWKNLFNKKGFLTLGFIALIFLLSLLAFKEQIGNYNAVMENPCSYCIDYQIHARKIGENYKNFSSFKFNVNLSNFIPKE